MKLTLHPRNFLPVVALFFFQFFLIRAGAQTLTPRYYQSMTPNTNGFYESLPKGYEKETESYPLIVFFTGIGELGDGGVDQLVKVLANGTPKHIKEGKFPSSFTVNGETFKFIVIIPQFYGWPSNSDVEGVINYAVKNYRVNTNRIYLTGLSMGAGAVWDYAGFSMENANRIAAIVPVCGVSGPIIERCTVFTDSKMPIWATHNIVDETVPSSNTIGYIDKITALSVSQNPLYLLNPLVKKTIFPVVSHDAWTATYDLKFKEKGMNIYEWMLQYSRDNTVGRPGPVPPQNQNPEAFAGSDVNITLPVNSTRLDGTGTDRDGTIAKYSWTKVSGPSQFNISSDNVRNPTISNLTEGSFIFRLTVTDNDGATAYNDLVIKVNPAPVVVNPVPVPGTVSAIPGKVEAENYSAMFGVMSEKTHDEGGGQDIGWIELGDWMEYSVNVETAGNYTVNFRVASPKGGQQLQLKSSDGNVLTTVNVPQTGNFQIWKTVTTTVTLKAGKQTLKIYSSENGWWNINWMDFSLITQVPVGNTYPIPGRIEAENYSAMFGVLSEPTFDNTGNRNLGWIERGDWMDYSVNAATAGTYTVNFRVASPDAGHQLQLKTSDGSILTTVDVPKTGSFQTWRTVSSSVTLNAGSQTLRVYSTKDGWWNINWIEFTAPTSLAGYTNIPSKIEAENFTAMFGIITEPSMDNGGGLNVGWIEMGDWMEYSVNALTAGNYGVNIRIASPFAGQQLQIRSASGTVLAVVNLPQTGNFQNWKTVSATITLPAGPQKLRLYSTQVGWINVNWLEFTGSSSASNEEATMDSRNLSGALIDADNSIVTAPVFSIYPNPVNNMFVMQIRNKYTGPMNVQVVNQAGSLIKQFKFTKDQQLSQLNLSVKELPTGTYFIKVQVGKWSDLKKMIKL